jgi:hypothetical protein
MTTLLAEHARHGSMPYHVLVSVGEALGVAARSVETPYNRHLVTLESERGLVLTEAQIAAITGATDFSEAYSRLRALGPVPDFALVDRAIWRDPSRALVGLRVAERRRRQVLGEATTCSACATVIAQAA